MTGVVVSIEGFELLAVERKLLQHKVVVGVVLFSENYKNAEQLKALVASIHALRPDLVTMVDQEGGVVQRFIDDANDEAAIFYPLPALHSFGEAYDQATTDTEKGAVLNAVKNAAITNARQLRSCGVDLLLGPVADLHDPDSPIIGGKDRAFHHDAQVVVTLVEAYLQGMEEGGMVRGVLKHFPGHGTIKHLDSHTDHVQLHGPIPELCVFQKLINEANPFAMMIAHVVYPDIDPDNVVGTSSVFQTMIRDEMGFDGMLISDCLSMRGAHGLCHDLLHNVPGDIEGLSSVFQKCLQRLLKRFAPYHDVIILTHAQTLWQTLFPNSTVPMPAPDALTLMIFDALATSELNVEAHEHAMLQQVRNPQVHSLNFGEAVLDENTAGSSTS